MPEEIAAIRTLLEEIGVDQNQVDEFMAVYKQAEAKPAEAAPRSDMYHRLEMEIANTKDWRKRAALVAKRISWDLG